MPVFHCGECHNNFPLNSWKHPYRKTVYCPFCMTEYKSPFHVWFWKRKPDARLKEYRPFTVADLRKLLWGMIAR